MVKNKNLVSTALSNIMYAQSMYIRATQYETDLFWPFRISTLIGT